MAKATRSFRVRQTRQHQCIMIMFLRNEKAQASIEIIIAIGILLTFTLVIIADSAVKNQTINALNQSWQLSNECEKVSNAIERTYLNYGTTIKLFVNQDVNISSDGNIFSQMDDLVLICTHSARTNDYFIAKGSTIKMSNIDDNKVVKIENG